MTTRRYETMARHALWVGGLLVILVGLFGMHGLDSHGTAGMGTMPDTAMTEPAMNVASPAHMTLSATTAVTGAAVATVTGAPTGHGAMDMVMAGMCLAILAGALIALLRFLRDSRVRRPVLWLLVRPARAPAFPGSYPATPSLIQLSIRRC